MKPKGTSTLRTDLLFALATLAATAVAGGVAAAPHLLTHRATPQEQVALVEERQAAAQDLIRQLDSVTAKVSDMTTEAENAVQLRPASAANTRLGDLADAAARHGVTIAQISSLSPDTKDPHAIIIPIKIAGTATFTQATGFVSELQTNFRDIGVTAFRLAGVPATGSPPPAANFTLDLAWYAAPANAAAHAARPGRAAPAGSAAPGSTGTKTP